MTRSDSARRRSERSHSRNEVTKKKKSSTTTPQNGFSSWRRSPVKNQRAISRFKQSAPAISPKLPENPGKRCDRDTHGGGLDWMDGKRGDGTPRLCGAKQKNRAAQGGTKCVRICASACYAVCPTPLAVENLSTREVAREVRRVS